MPQGFSVANNEGERSRGGRSYLNYSKAIKLQIQVWVPVSGLGGFARSLQFPLFHICRNYSAIYFAINSENKDAEKSKWTLREETGSSRVRFFHLRWLGEWYLRNRRAGKSPQDGKNFHGAPSLSLSIRPHLSPSLFCSLLLFLSLFILLVLLLLFTGCDFLPLNLYPFFLSAPFTFFLPSF